jgi:hypothetical protein
MRNVTTKLPKIDRVKFPDKDLVYGAVSQLVWMPGGTETGRVREKNGIAEYTWWLGKGIRRTIRGEIETNRGEREFSPFKDTDYLAMYEHFSRRIAPARGCMEPLAA